MTISPQQGLDVPAGADELDRQPVEQLGMAGRLALRAEIIDVLTSPVPKSICHSRLTATRAVSGSAVTSQRASASRSPHRRFPCLR